MYIPEFVYVYAYVPYVGLIMIYGQLSESGGKALCYSIAVLSQLVLTNCNVFSTSFFQLSVLCIAHALKVRVEVKSSYSVVN